MILGRFGRNVSLLILSCVCTQSLRAEKVSFSETILPLLSDRCFQCHGPDEANREAGLRLDQPKIVSSEGTDEAVVVPFDLDKSTLWQRVTSEEEDLVMPPPDSHRVALSDEEVAAIREWIISGAAWEDHWAFKPVVVSDAIPPDTNPIDHFIDKRLSSEAISSNEQASDLVKLRRLSFALRGVSPSVEESASYLKMPVEARWGSTVEQYLHSSLHAERLAMWWLDAARYSDSDGYQQDLVRENWPWRDWVIDAFRSNMPFDQFTIEQFAGDLLDGATPEQILATCFHRNHMTNGEGGRDPEESRVDYVLDRTNTMGTVWLGLTLGCTQCHSHKFDPISQNDYYSLTAFFNSIDEDGKAGKNAKPYLSYESPYAQQRIEAGESLAADCEVEEKRLKAVALERFEEWLGNRLSLARPSAGSWLVPNIVSLSSSEGTRFEVSNDGIIQTVGATPRQDDYRIDLEIPENIDRITGWRIEIMPSEQHVNGMFTRAGTGDFILTNVKTLVRQRGNPNEVELENVSAVADYQAKKDRKTDWDTRYSNIKETLNDDARDGWTTQGAEVVEPHMGVFSLSEPYWFKTGDRLSLVLKQRSTLGEANIGRFRVSITAERGETLTRTDSGSPITELASLESPSRENLSGDLVQRLRTQFLLDQDDYQAALRRLDSARKQLKSLRDQTKPRSVMVLKQREEPRKTHLLVRGVWDAEGEQVQPGFLPSIYPGNDDSTGGSASGRTRLDLARWLISPDNPLTSRVIVNHLWQLMFGRGLVATVEDFGLQGERPSHPELLDYLASELVSSKWDLRHILRLIVSSETFQRSSQVHGDALERDPDNVLLARGPRFRLDAWMLRDNALRMAGLLDEQVGGPPVFPYQPRGVWAEITMGRFNYEPSLGVEQHRRTIYAFWRRSSSPAFLFDSAQRRVCEVRTNRTNTPLHALTLMNDETYLECARVIGEQLAGIEDFDTAAQTLARIVLTRDWGADEMEIIRRVYQSSIEHFERDREAAVSYVTVGQYDASSVMSLPETAAWMSCVNMVLNLDESMSFE